MDMDLRAEMATIPLASAELGQSAINQPTADWRGFVDTWSPALGIAGWALQTGISASTSPVEIELWVGDLRLANTLADKERLDVSAAAGRDVSPGFVFEPLCFGRMARLSSDLLDCPVFIRIAGGPRLRSSRPEPVARDLVEVWQQHLLAELRGEGSVLAAHGRRLLSRISGFHQDAIAMRELALVPIARQELGQVEVLHVSESGLVWIIGWIRRDIGHEASAVVVERQKFAAGISFFRYERADIPSNCTGFIGVIESNWLPSAQSRDFFIYLGPDGQAHLRAGTAVRLVQHEVFVALTKDARDRIQDGKSDAIFDAFAIDNVWGDSVSSVATVECLASLDRILLVPGFGCLVEGWMISLARNPKTFRIRIGQVVLEADPCATYFKPRPDLADMCHGYPEAADRAGFITVFRGDLPADVSGRPVLGIEFTDDSCSVRSCDPKVMRLLDPLHDSEAVMRMFSALQDEPFFDALHRAIQMNLKERCVAPLAIHEHPARCVVVIQCPDHAERLFLLQDELLAHAGELARRGIGLVMLGGRGVALGALKRQAMELIRHEPGLKLSLYAIEHAAGALDSLPFVMNALKAERFVYLGKELMLTTKGWQAVFELTDHIPGVAPEFFEVLNELGHPDSVHGALTTEAFSWNSHDHLEWAARWPKFVHGSFRDNGLLSRSDIRIRVIRGAALRLRAPTLSALSEVLDQASVRAAMLA